MSITYGRTITFNIPCFAVVEVDIQEIEGEVVKESELVGFWPSLFDARAAIFRMEADNKASHDRHEEEVRRSFGFRPTEYVPRQYQIVPVSNVQVGRTLDALEEKLKAAAILQAEGVSV